MNSSPGDVGAKRVELSLAETVEESIAGIVIVRDGLVGKLQVVSSSYIGILSKDTYYGTVYIGRQVVQVDR